MAYNPNKQYTLEEIATELSNDIYGAAHWFERAEGRGLIHGNGHHMAQELAAEAVRRLRERSTEAVAHGVVPDIRIE